MIVTSRQSMNGEKCKENSGADRKQRATSKEGMCEIEEDYNIVITARERKRESLRPRR